MKPTVAHLLFLLLSTLTLLVLSNSEQLPANSVTSSSEQFYNYGARIRPGVTNTVPAPPVVPGPIPEKLQKVRLVQPKLKPARSQTQPQPQATQRVQHGAPGGHVQQNGQPSPLYSANAVDTDFGRGHGHGQNGYDYNDHGQYPNIAPNAIPTSTNRPQYSNPISKVIINGQPQPGGFSDYNSDIFGSPSLYQDQESVDPHSHQYGGRIRAGENANAIGLGPVTPVQVPVPAPVHPEYTKNYWLSTLKILDVVLENLNVFKDSITLSGFSSGGGLAQQMLISYPSLFKGIGVFQQTYYRCGRGNGDVTDFDNTCTNLGNQTYARPYDPKLVLNDINAYFHNGLIEDPKNLQHKGLYIYVGLQNDIFRPEQMLSTIRIFQPYIKDDFRIRTRVQDSANLLPTDTFGLPCDQLGLANHFLGNCGLSGAYEALSFLLGEDTIKYPDEKVKINLSSLLEFDQSEFFDGITGLHFMAKRGLLYVPNRCGPNSAQKCLFHIYFHGCRSGRDFNDGNHIRHSGFLELAEQNNIIVLFPQIQRREGNTQGCWDTIGVTGALYATQKGLQVTIMRRMLARILGEDKRH